MLKHPFGAKPGPDAYLAAAVNALMEFSEDDESLPTPAMLGAGIRRLGEKMRHWRRSWAEIEVDRRRIDVFQGRIADLIAHATRLPESKTKQAILDLLTAPLPLDAIT